MSANRIMRYNFGERVNHWISGLSYTYLLITGLAFWSPYMFWMVILVGGGPAARFWHPWVGLMFSASMLWMYNIWSRDMRATKEDMAWKDAFGQYIRNEDDQLPPAGRFNWGQKQFFWVMLYAMLGLLISGVGLWFVDYIPWNLRYLRYASVLVHVVCALISIGAFIIHVYMGTAMVRGGFTSIIRGEVTSDWAKLHHRLWYEKMTGGTAASSRK